jgi:polysaccharide biosynthesis/export protein
LRTAIIRFLTLAFAIVSASATSPEGVSSNMRSYKLAPGDRIAVTVFGEAELSGEFPIDETGNIQMPLVGTISVGRITIEECRQRLIERLTDGFLKKPAVSVRISEFRPIYVLGDVRAPGSYPFRVGLSGTGAIALAGGIGSSEVRQGTAMADLLAAEERVTVLEWTRRRTIVRLARLEAERDGKGTFDVSKISDAAGPDIARLVLEERQQLSAEQKAHEHTLGLLRHQMPKLQTEIEATQEQIVSETRQLQLSQARVKEYERLAKLGLSQVFRELEFQGQTTQREGNIARLKAEQARLDARLGDLNLRLHEVENTRQTRISAELRETKVRLRDIESSLPSAREVLALRQQQAGLISEEDGIAHSYRIFLLRGQGGRLQPVLVSEEIAIEPGDILEVRRSRSAAGGIATSEPCGPGDRLSCPDSGGVSLIKPGSQQNRSP